MRPNRGVRAVVLSAGAAVIAILVIVTVNRKRLVGWYLMRRDFEAIGKNSQGLLEFRHQETGIVFVGLPGGECLIGSRAGEAERREDERQHEVRLSPFLIAKNEISQAEWKRLTGQNPSHFVGDDLPVDSVSWYDCRDALERSGLALPTEAQWEFACRSGTTGSFAGTGRLEEMGWFRGNSRQQTHPVGRLQPNGFGLHDMHGNVSEWCRDIYDRNYGPRSISDPVSLTESSFRALRGGSCIDHSGSCRSARRLSESPSKRFSFIGCRPVFELP